MSFLIRCHLICLLVDVLGLRSFLVFRNVSLHWLVIFCCMMRQMVIFLALMDGSWITAMRTGAVAALSIQYLRTSSAREYAFMGLGNTARATLLCLMAVLEGPLNIRLLSYKGQELEFMKRFKEYSRLNFSIFENVEDLITGADVVVSCVTVAHGQFASDTCFKPGVLVVPVHTRGFQNCDLFFRSDFLLMMSLM